MLWRRKPFRKWLYVPLLILIAGFFVPQKMVITVQGATLTDWDVRSCWAYPWGSSITHKGIDLFKAKGTDVISSTYGIVM